MENDLAVSNSLGVVLYVDPEDRRGRHLAESGGSVYASSLMLWQKALDLSDWDLVIDVGANYGEMIANVDLSRFSTVVAYEPNPHVLPFLRKTVAELPWTVSLREAAVSARPGAQIELAVDRRWSGKTTLQHNADPRLDEEHLVTATAPVTTLDELLTEGDYASACIKIDIEGEEMAALAGAATLLRELRQVACVIEILHMSVESIAGLAREYPMFLLEEATGRLVQVQGKDRNSLGRTLHSGVFSKQDALLLAGTERRQLAGAIRSANMPGAGSHEGGDARPDEIQLLKERIVELEGLLRRAETHPQKLRRRVRRLRETIKAKDREIQQLQATQQNRRARRLGGLRGNVRKE